MKNVCFFFVDHHLDQLGRPRQVHPDGVAQPLVELDGRRTVEDVVAPGAHRLRVAVGQAQPLGGQVASKWDELPTEQAFVVQTDAVVEGALKF